MNRKTSRLTSKIILIIVSASALLFAVACGNSAESNIDTELVDVQTILSVNELEVTQTESVSVTVDINAPENISVSGYTFDLPEDLSNISVSTGNCDNGVGSTSCEEWIITPGIDAIPGVYRISITASSPNQGANLFGDLLILKVKANTFEKSAPAAIKVSGSGGIWHIITSDQKRWSWANEFINNNEFGSAGVGGYLRLDPGGNRNLDRVSPIEVDIAAPHESSNLWASFDGNVRTSIGATIEGMAYTWGKNSTALGYRTDQPVSLPRQVSSLANVTQVAVTNSELRSTSFALIDGEVIAWGSNEHGLHGVNSDDSTETNVFSTAQGLENITQISTGQNHILALRSDGTVWSWGNNQRGQLGIGDSSEKKLIPFLVASLSDVIQIDAAGDFSLALTSDGKVWSWGSNSQKQLGIDSSQDFFDSPQQVTGFDRAFQISAMNQAGQSMGFVFEESTGLVWRWGQDQPRPIALPLVISELGPGLVIDRSCQVTDSGRPGFLWDVRHSPNEPMKLISFFGRKDSNCPNRLFLGSNKNGETQVAPSPDLTNGDYSLPTQVELMAVPNPGWRLDPINPWFGSEDCDDGRVLVEGGVQCFAQYIPNDSQLLTITLQGQGSVTSAPAGIDCNTDCGELFATGTEVTLTATPDQGSSLASWSGDLGCDQVNENGQLVVTMSQDLNCVATFAPVIENRTLTVTLSGNGTVTSSPAGIDCPQDCSEVFQQGKQIQLTAQADEGWSFVRWTGDSNCSASGVATLGDSDLNCIAEFSENGPTATLTLIIQGGPGAGEVNSSELPIPTMQCINSDEVETTCSAEFPLNANVDLIASAFGSNNNISWTGCDETGGSRCLLSMSQNRSVTAVFSTLQAFTLDLDVSGGGRLFSRDGSLDCAGGNTGTCSASYFSGQTVIIEQEANNGEILSNWFGDDSCGVGGSLVSLPITMNANKSCGANFTGAQANENRLCTMVRNETGNEAPGSVFRSTNGRIDNNTSQNIECHYHPTNTQVTLTPQANAGLAFYRWEGFGCYNNMIRTGDFHQPETRIDLPPDATCTAVFRNDINRLNVEVGGSSTGIVISAIPDGAGGFSDSGFHACRETCNEPTLSSSISGLNTWLRATHDNPNWLISWVGCDEVRPDPAGGALLCRVNFQQSVGQQKEVSVNFTSTIP